MRRRKVLFMMIVASIFVLPILGVQAAASVNGPANTVLGMPVQMSVRGAAADTKYEVVCYTGTNNTFIEEINSDSDGTFVFSVTYYDGYGQNSYAIRADGAGAQLATFNVDNLDIVPYLVVLLTVVIIFGVIGMFDGKGGLL